MERGAALPLLPVLAAYAAKRRGLLPSLDRVTLGRKTPVPRRQLSSLLYPQAVAGEMEPQACQRRRQQYRLLTDPLVAELSSRWHRQQQLGSS